MLSTKEINQLSPRIGQTSLFIKLVVWKDKLIHYAVEQGLRVAVTLARLSSGILLTVFESMIEAFPEAAFRSVRR